jgi:probable rRNA maturation factor
MIDFINETDYNLELEPYEKILAEISDKDLEFILTTNDIIQQINKEYRGIDKPTDVLSFPVQEFPNSPLGTIIISLDLVKEVAEHLGHSLEDEIKLLFIHGCLHLIGYDHEIDDGEHRLREEELVKLLNLPKSLIVRNS